MGLFFNYVIVNLVVIHRIVIEVLLDYTGLRFIIIIIIFCRAYPSFKSWSATTRDPRARGACDADPSRSLPDTPLRCLL